jgi:hypothetical protein
MTIRHLFAVVVIFVCTTVAWFLLGKAISVRSHQAATALGPELRANWGPELIQTHPTAHYAAPTSGGARRIFAPETSRVSVDLRYLPKQKGLLRYRTYEVDFEAAYTLRNPAPITQTLYFEFALPDANIRYDRFALKTGATATDRVPEAGRIREAVRLEAGEVAVVSVAYRANGLGEWSYTFGDTPRVRDFELAMTTDFREYDIPAGAVSATLTEATDGGMRLVWKYDDVINAQRIGMAMPNILNPGPVASRITFFAPVSLLFFFSVLVIVGTVRGQALHPMHYFFLAAGYFAFQLSFAYLADLVSPVTAFAIASGISLTLVNLYLWRAKGARLARISIFAQFAYMVLFSASFFFDGLTGITITIGAIITLALLMAMTARTNWQEVFAKPSPQT